MVWVEEMWLFSAIFGISLVVYALHASATQPALQMEVFRHEVVNGQTSLILGFNRSDIAVSMDGVQATPIGDNLFAVSYGLEEADGDGIFDGTRRVVEIDVDGDRETLKIDRQGAAELLEVSGFDKSDGYSVIASASFSLPASDKAYEYEFVRHGGFLPDLEPLSAPGVPHALQRAASISAWLDAEGLTYSPSVGSMEHVPWNAHLENLRNGKDGLQCLGYRSLFTSIALEAGIELRWIGLFSFSLDGLDDAIPYSHAAVEVLTDDYGWVYYDPWHNLAFAENGEWLDTQAIRAGLGVPIRVIENARRVGRLGLGEEREVRNWSIRHPDLAFYRSLFGAVDTITLTY